MINPPEIGFLTSSTRLEDPSKAMKKKTDQSTLADEKKKRLHRKSDDLLLDIFPKKTDELGVHENPGASH